VDLKFVFTIGRGLYALPVEAVDHTLAVVEAAPVPWMPAYHRGLFPYRGEILPLLDLRPFLNEYPAAGEEAEGSILVINAGQSRFAAAARSPQFISIPQVDWPLHPEASIFPALDSQMLVDGRSITLLNAERLQIEIQRALREHFRDLAAA
jgi:chemotaxis signal transduction protein